MVDKMKKILPLIIFLLLGNLAFSQTDLDDYVSEEFDKSKSGGAQFVKTPKDAAKNFIRKQGFKIGLNTKSDGSSFFLSIGQGSVSVTSDVQSIHDARFNGFRKAIQNAKAEMVKFLGESVATSLTASVKENTMPEKISEEIVKKTVGTDSSEYEKLQKLINLKLDRALKEEVPEEAYTIPIGEANILEEGNDVTIISYGAMIQTVNESLEMIKKDGMTAELIDLRTLSPLDSETIIKSVKKTGRLVIVHEAPKTLGMSAEISALIAENCLEYLEAPVQRVAGLDTPFPYSLEKEYIPDAKVIYNKIKRTVEYS